MKLDDTSVIYSAPNGHAGLLAVLENAPASVRRKFHRIKQAIECLDGAKPRHRGKLTRTLARRLHISVKTLYNMRSRCRRIGPVALINRRMWQAWRKSNLPVEFCIYIRSLSNEAGLSRPAVLRHLTAQLARWRSSDPLAAIPGYATAPTGNPPPGWSSRNLSRYLRAQPCAEVILKLSADGSTSILRGKLSRLAMHPLRADLAACLKNRKAPSTPNFQPSPP
jgi:hypothetical protein